MHPLTSRIFPFLLWWPKVNRNTLRHDWIAGLTGAVIVLPQGVAFATIAGMPPEYGLYAGMVPAIIAALFGSSWHLVSGPTTAASVVMFSVLSELAVPESARYIALALTLTFMVGIMQIAMGIAHLGRLVNFISHSVIVGFTAGAALLIASKQLKNFIGIETPVGLNVVESIYHAGTHISEAHLETTLVALVTLGGGILCKRLYPKFPFLVVALLFGSITAAIINLLQSNSGLLMVGALPGQLPPLSSPNLNLSVMQELIPAAIAITILAITEAVSIARSIGVKSGQHIDGNQEFIGQGLSNVCGSFFSGYVATGSFNRSGVNYDTGARTPLASIFAGLLLIVIVLFVAPLAIWLPNAAMAGILFLVAWSLIDFHHIKTIVKASYPETLVMAVTFLGTLTLDLDFALLLGVMFSLAMYLKRSAKPEVQSRVPNPANPKRKFTTDASLPECPQLKMLRIDGSIFFGSVAHIRETLTNIRNQSPDQKHLLLFSQSISMIDVSGSELIAEEVKHRRKKGGKVFFQCLKDSAKDVMERGGYLKDLSPEPIFTSKGDALEKIFDHLDKDICKHCDKRIFNECKGF